MTHTENSKETWFVVERAELIAKQFLLELGAVFYAEFHSDNEYDYIVQAGDKSESIKTFYVTLKATQADLKKVDNNGKYPFTFPVRNYNLAVKSNVPVLLLVVNVKDVEIYFKWLNHPKDVLDIPSENRTSVVLHLQRVSDKEKIDLAEDIAAL